MKVQSQRVGFKYDREELKHVAKMKKKAQDELDHKMKYFKLFRWALIRDTRKEMERAQLEKLKKMRNVTRTIKYSHAYLIY